MGREYGHPLNVVLVDAWTPAFAGVTAMNADLFNRLLAASALAITSADESRQWHAGFRGDSLPRR